MLPETPPPFSEYTLAVPGLGTVTVLDPAGEPGYRVRLPTGAVTAYPAQSGEPSEANAAADLAHAVANPATLPTVRRQDTRIILDRLTSEEAAALTACTHAGIRLLILKATSTGAIRDDDADFPAAVAGLHALGIIAESRWNALFAP